MFRSSQSKSKRESAERSTQRSGRSQEGEWEDLDAQSEVKSGASSHGKKKKHTKGESETGDRASRSERDERRETRRKERLAGSVASEPLQSRSQGELMRGFDGLSEVAGYSTSDQPTYPQDHTVQPGTSRPSLSSRVQDQFPGQNPLDYTHNPYNATTSTISQGMSGPSFDDYLPHTGNSNIRNRSIEDQHLGNTERMLRISRPALSSKPSINSPSTASELTWNHPLNQPGASGKGEAASYYDTSLSMAPSVPSVASQPQLSHSISSPAVPSASYHTAPTPSTKPPDQTQSDITTYAASAGIGGFSAGAYAIDEHHQDHSEHYVASMHVYHPDEVESAYQNPSTSDTYGQGSPLLAQAHRPRRRGPVDRLLDILQNKEDIRNMEEYTEYIGVCRYCFDPASSATEAPRQHHFRGRRSSDSLRRRSSESLRRAHKRGSKNAGVDKDSRYCSSDSSHRSRKRSSWIGAGLAGYGLAQVGAALWNKRDPSRDASNSATRKYDRPPSYQSGGRGSRATERGVIHDHEDRAFEFVRHKDGSISKAVRPQHAENRLASHGPEYAGVPSVGIFVRRRQSDQSSSSGSDSPGLGEILGFTQRRKSRRRRRASPKGSFKESVKPTRSGHGIFGGFFPAEPGAQKRGTTSTGGFFNFANDSSSSTASDVAVGSSLGRRSNHKRPTNKRSKDDLNATMLEVGATAAALTAASHGTRRPEVVAVRQRKTKHANRDRRSTKRQTTMAEDEWESASEDESISAASDLAFGDFHDSDQNNRRRASTESITSQSSGLSKWGWRWGGKRVKRKDENVRPSLSTGLSDALAPSTWSPTPKELGSATDASTNRRPMQVLSPEPVPETAHSVPRAYASDHNSSSVRPSPMPLQDPQPPTPMRPEIHPARAHADSTYGALTRASTFPTQDGPERRRRNSSPGSRNFARDTAIVDAAAAATTSIASGLRSSKENSPDGVRLDLTDKQARKIEQSERGGANQNALRRAAETDYLEDEEAQQRAGSIPREAEQQAEMDRRDRQERRDGGRPRASELTPLALADRSEVTARELELEVQIQQKKRELEERARSVEMEDPSDSIEKPSSTSIIERDKQVRFQSRPFEQEPQYEVEPMSPVNLHDGPRMMNDEIFDPDFFKRPRSESEIDRYADIARKVTARIVAENESKYTDPQPTQAQFFYPDILSRNDQTKKVIRDIESDNDYQINYVDVEHNAAVIPLDIAHSKKPWSIPSLEVIAPTPPISIAGSTKGQKSPDASPILEQEENAKSSPSDIQESLKNRVSWGSDETRIYKIDNSEVSPEHSSKEFDSRDEIVVDVEDPGHEHTKRYVVDDQPAHSATDSRAADEYVENVVREVPEAATRGFYRSPFFETVSDLGIALDSPKANVAPVDHGFVIGEIEGPTPTEEKLSHMPGSFDFDDDEVPSRDTRDGTAAENLVPDPAETGDKPIKPQEPTASTRSPPVSDDGMSQPESQERENARKSRTEDETALSDPESKTLDEASAARTPTDAAELVPLSKKDRRKRDKAALSSSREDYFGEREEKIASPDEAQRFETPLELPLSKKEQKRREKAALRGYSEDEPKTPMETPMLNPSESRQSETPYEDALEVPLSRKKQKKRDKAARLAEAIEVGPSPPAAAENDDWNVPLSSKERKKRSKQARKGGFSDTVVAVMAGGAAAATAALADSSKSSVEGRGHEKDHARERTVEVPVDAYDDLLDNSLPARGNSLARVVEDEEEDTKDVSADRVRSSQSPTETTISALNDHEYGEPRRRKKKHRSSGDFDDDAASVASGHTTRSSRRGDDELKRDKIGGIFGLFRRKSSDKDLYAEEHRTADNDGYEDSRRRHLRRGTGDSDSRRETSSTRRSAQVEPDASSSQENHEHRDDKDDNARSFHSTLSRHRDKYRARDDVVDEQEDQSFLDKRAEVEEPPALPADATTAATPAPESTAEDNDVLSSLPPLPKSRPSSPLGVGEEAEPASLPLPVSRPSSPTGIPLSAIEAGETTETRPLQSSPIHASPSTHSFHTPRRPMLPIRPSSSTTVPLRFRRPPGSPSLSASPQATRERAASFSSPVPPSPTSPISLSASRLGHRRGRSNEMRHFTEFQPLYLVEQNRKSLDTPAEEEQLPSLPSSKPTSRASSAPDTEYKSVPEELSASDRPILPSLKTDDFRQDHGPDDVFGSGHSTPKATHFPPSVRDHVTRAQPEFYSWEDVLREENMRNSAAAAAQAKADIEPARAAPITATKAAIESVLDTASWPESKSGHVRRDSEADAEFEKGQVATPSDTFEGNRSPLRDVGNVKAPEDEFSADQAYVSYQAQAEPQQEPDNLLLDRRSSGKTKNGKKGKKAKALKLFSTERSQTVEDDKDQTSLPHAENVTVQDFIEPPTSGKESAAAHQSDLQNELEQPTPVQEKMSHMPGAFDYDEQRHQNSEADRDEAAEQNEQVTEDLADDVSVPVENKSKNEYKENEGRLSDMLTNQKASEDLNNLSTRNAKDVEIRPASHHLQPGPEERASTPENTAQRSSGENGALSDAPETSNDAETIGKTSAIPGASHDATPDLEVEQDPPAAHDESFAFTIKQSKKDKRKAKKAKQRGLSVDPSIDDSEPPIPGLARSREAQLDEEQAIPQPVVLQQGLSNAPPDARDDNQKLQSQQGTDPSNDPTLTNVNSLDTLAVDAETEAIKPKLSKKDKRKAKKNQAWFDDFEPSPSKIEVSPQALVQDVAAEADQDQSERQEPDEAEIVEMPKKVSKKEKRKAKKAARLETGNDDLGITNDTSSLENNGQHKEIDPDHVPMPGAFDPPAIDNETEALSQEERDIQRLIIESRGTSGSGTRGSYPVPEADEVEALKEPQSDREEGMSNNSLVASPEQAPHDKIPHLDKETEQESRPVNEPVVLASLDAGRIPSDEREAAHEQIVSDYPPGADDYHAVSPGSSAPRSQQETLHVPDDDEEEVEAAPEHTTSYPEDIFQNVQADSAATPDRHTVHYHLHRSSSRNLGLLPGDLPFSRQASRPTSPALSHGSSDGTVRHHCQRSASHDLGLLPEDLDASRHSSRAASPISASPAPHDVGFAAALAAGLGEAGFDPDIVVNDPSYYRRASPPGTAELDPEDELALCNLTGRETMNTIDTEVARDVAEKGAKDQTIMDGTDASPARQAIGSVAQERDYDQPSRDDDFDAALAASLGIAGFSAADMLARSADVADEPAEFAFTIPKNKKKRKGKGNKISAIEEPAHESSPAATAGEKPDKTIASERTLQPFEESQEAQPVEPIVEDVKTTKKGKKAKKSKKGKSFDWTADNDEAEPTRPAQEAVPDNKSQSVPAGTSDIIQANPSQWGDMAEFEAVRRPNTNSQEQPIWSFDKISASRPRAEDLPDRSLAETPREINRDSGYDTVRNSGGTAVHDEIETQERESGVGDSFDDLDLPVQKSRSGDEPFTHEVEDDNHVRDNFEPEQTAPKSPEPTTKDRASYLFNTPSTAERGHLKSTNSSDQKTQGDYFEGRTHESTPTPEHSRLPLQSADMFSRIHANTSPTPSTRGLWLATSPIDEDRVFSSIDDRLHASELEKRFASDIRSPSAQSHASIGSGWPLRSPDQLRSMSAASNRSLKRTDRSMSGDLRAAARRGEPSIPAPSQASTSNINTRPSFVNNIQPLSFQAPLTPPLNEADAAAATMANVYEGWGDGEHMAVSPTRPSSARKRQSMQLMDLEAKINQLTEENRRLQDAHVNTGRSADDNSTEECSILREALQNTEIGLREKDVQITQIRALLDPLQAEVNRLTEINENLGEANRNLIADTNDRYATLQSEHAHAENQWQQSSRELEDLRKRHVELSSGMDDIVREHVDQVLEDKNTEIQRLRDELESATSQIRALQSQIRHSSSFLDYLPTKNEDYFDSACQKLCQAVQQWILRFSKSSDNRACRLSDELDNDKLEARLDNVMLDGSDVDKLLVDRIRRRDVFMALTMAMVWEYVFTRYLFGMDREQRQKLKALEKTLHDVGPPRAVAHWRATTLTLLSRRPQFAAQRALDTEAVTHEIFSTLAALLPPPAALETQLLAGLKKVLRLAVDLAIEFRLQRPEYLMLPPPCPEYDSAGDLVRKTRFEAGTMNERSGEWSDNEELVRQGAVVKMVLFPLVIKKGDDEGEGGEETIICPAQVLVAGERGGKRVRMDLDVSSLGTGVGGRSKLSVGSMGTF